MDVFLIVWKHLCERGYITSSRERKMTDSKQIEEAIGAIILGIFGGMIAASIINYLTKRSTCPVCKQQIKQGTNRCPYCQTYLEWD